MSLPAGKISPKILKRTIFNHLGSKRDDVIIISSEGEDAAIVRVGDKLVAVHCDPISGAYSNIGWISVNIVTNDLATSGVRPCWLLSCIMLPPSSNEKMLNDICIQMSDAAEKIGVSIIGGHSEITIGLDHPLVIASAFGIIEDKSYVTTGGAKPGSRIILTKSIGIEGTAILASDIGKPLAYKFGKDFLDRSKGYFDKLSILKEALIAFNYGGVLAMHDPTEGGIAGALNEIANASKTGFKVYEDKIKIGTETSEICHFFKIDPLRLISSGSLLIVAIPEKADEIVRRLKKEGIEASVIGDVLDNTAYRSIVRRSGLEEELPMPESDELYKVLKKKPIIDAEEA